MRARRLPSETRRRVCHVSSGDQHRSSKMDSSVGEAVGGPWAWLWAWVRWVLCCAVRPLSRQGISTACPLGTDLGMKVDLPRPPRGAGQVGAVQGGGVGRGRLFRDARRCRLRLCTRGTTPCRCRALTCSGRSWLDTVARGARPRVRCGARGARAGVRGKGGGSEISCGVGPLILA